MGTNETQSNPGWPGGIAPGLSDLLGGGLAGLVGSTRRDLAARSVTGSAGGGAVTVTMTGEGRLTGLEIDPDAFHEMDRSSLEDLVVAAAASAFEEVAKAKSGALGGALSTLGFG